MSARSRPTAPVSDTPPLDTRQARRALEELRLAWSDCAVAAQNLGAAQLHLQAAGQSLREFLEQYLVGSPPVE